MSKNPWPEYKKQIDNHIEDYSPFFPGLRSLKEGTDGWMVACCPFHEDRNPSFAFNRKTGKWCCFAGCGKGGPFDYIMQTSGKSFKETLLDVGDRLGIPRPPRGKPARMPIKESLVKQWVSNLWANEEVLRWLREKRGLSDATLRKYEIGWDPKRQRNTIPIRDERGNLVNVRLYNAKKDSKMINYTEGKWKYGSPARLYGLNELVKYKGKQVVVTEGEFDRLLLQQEGLMAVTSTHGCSVFRPEWIPHFKDKDVVIIYDCDKEGQAGANTVLKAFKNSEAGSIKNVVLPLKGDKDDKDITDYFHKRGFTGADLQRMIDETPVHRYEEEKETEEVVRLESFTEVEQKELIDKKVRCEITVCGETSEAFHAVEEFRVTFCPKLKKGECFDCAEPIKVPRGAQEYIGSCMSTNVQLIAMLRALCCRYGQKPSIEILKRTTVKEFFCHQKVSRLTRMRDEDGNVVQVIDGKNQELLEKRVYYLSNEHPKPGHYLATGWVKSHPKTQQVTFLIEGLEPQEDDYERFRLEDNVHLLRSLHAMSIGDIVRDLRDHVTRIYKRDEIILAILLAYCSPRWFKLGDEYLRGWLTAVILGDSGTGKTQTFDRLSEFLGLGDVFSGLTGSRTGLAYALVEHKQKGWQVKVGRYPGNSRKLLAVDEVQEVPRSQLKTIAKAMDEGFMQIDRVSSRGYESQTRLIMLGNPKKEAIMDDHQYGCVTLKAIFPVMMIRRLDIAVFASTNDIETLKFITEKRREAGGPKVSREALRALVYWAWNLRPDDVVISEEARQACIDEVQDLAMTYGYATDVPLINRYECDKTVARVAVAFAVLDVSADATFTRVLVKPEHMMHAGRFLRSIYSHKNCMLDTYSRLCREQEELNDYEAIRDEFMAIIAREKYGRNTRVFQRLIYALWTTGIRKDNRRVTIRRNELADIAGCDATYVSKKLRMLKRYSMIEATGDGYVKLPKFIRFLRELLREHPEFFEPGAEAFEEDESEEGGAQFDFQ